MSMTLGADKKSTPIGPNFANGNYARMFADAIEVLDEWYDDIVDSVQGDKDQEEESKAIRMLLIDAKSTFIQGIPVDGISGPMQAKELKTAVALVLRGFMFDYVVRPLRTPSQEMLESIVRLTVVNDWLVDVDNDSEITAN
tara:strand:+ start:39 stop:461 length:423 start_codon:yes stop_codon:yes gene_type:complete